MNENNVDIKEILEFYLRAGVDETCGNDVFFQTTFQKKTENVENVLSKNLYFPSNFKIRGLKTDSFQHLGCPKC